MAIKLSPITGELDYVVDLPGSKSFSNRALLLSSLAGGVSKLHSISPSDDSKAMCAVLKQMGAIITNLGDDTLQVDATGLSPYSGESDVGPAGTTMRFLTARLAAMPGADVTLRGTERMHQRPIRELVDALRSLGAEIEYVGAEGCPPLRIKGKKLAGGCVSLAGNVSSQFVSALLLVGATFEKGLSLSLREEPVSRSYLDMTLATLEAFGVTVSAPSEREFVLEPQSVRASTYRSEGDASGASYLFGIAALSGGMVKVRNLSSHSTQGDVRFPELLAEMGCSVSHGEDDTTPWIAVQGGDSLVGLTADMTLMPDTAQTLAVIAAAATGTTTLTGLGTLRVKETDRIAALSTELAKLGVETRAGEDWLEIDGKGGVDRFPAASIATYDDHRMAMSFAQLAAVTSGITIEDPQVVSKSFPNFWGVLEAMGISNVAL